jgi:hypothetical protein
VIAEGDLDEMRQRAEERVMAAVEFADASPEPALETMYDNLYVLGEEAMRGWYAVDERTPETHPGEREREVGAEGEIRKLAEAGAAYAGQADRRRRPPQEGQQGDEESEGEPDG